MEVLVVGSKCCGSSDENIGDEMEVSTLNNQQGCEVTECRRGGGGGGSLLVMFTVHLYLILGCCRRQWTQFWPPLSLADEPNFDIAGRTVESI
jgi:hypothetical protein